MNINKYILVCLLAWLVVPANAAIDENAAGWLDKLDASLAKRSYFEKQRIDPIENLKAGLKKARTDYRKYEQM